MSIYIYTGQPYQLELIVLRRVTVRTSPYKSSLAREGNSSLRGVLGRTRPYKPSLTTGGSGVHNENLRCLVESTWFTFYFGIELAIFSLAFESPRLSPANLYRLVQLDSTGKTS